MLPMSPCLSATASSSATLDSSTFTVGLVLGAPHRSGWGEEGQIVLHLVTIMNFGRGSEPLLQVHSVEVLGYGKGRESLTDGVLPRKVENVLRVTCPCNYNGLVGLSSTSSDVVSG